MNVSRELAPDPFHPARLQWLTVPALVAAWGIMRSRIWAVDGAALLLLVGIMGWQHRQRRRRALRLQRVVADLDEQLTLNAQAVEAAQQAHESLERKLARYQRLHAVAEQLSRLADLESVSRLAVERAFELIGKSSVCLLYLVDPERQELALRASRKAPSVEPVRAKQGDQFDRYVLRTHRPLLVNDVRRDFRFTISGQEERPIASVMACPVMVGASAEGVLRLDSPTAGVYTQDDLRFLDILLDLVDTAITNARLFAQTQQLAFTDGLTGLYRRQPFLEQLARELARADRSRESVAVLMLDLDNFKQYNDAHGHPAGDAALKMVAQVLRAAVPPEGLCVRYGGEEMAVLLPTVSREQAGALAERIRCAVEAEALRAYGPVGPEAQAPGSVPGTPVTVSVGVALYPEDAQSDIELIRRADERLYQAKRAGKNQVVG